MIVILRQKLHALIIKKIKANKVTKQEVRIEICARKATILMASMTFRRRLTSALAHKNRLSPHLSNQRLGARGSPRTHPQMQALDPASTNQVQSRRRMHHRPPLLMCLIKLMTNKEKKSLLRRNWTSGKTTQAKLTLANFEQVSSAILRAKETK